MIFPGLSRRGIPRLRWNLVRIVPYTIGRGQRGGWAKAGPVAPRSSSRPKKMDPISSSSNHDAARNLQQPYRRLYPTSSGQRITIVGYDRLRTGNRKQSDKGGQRGERKRGREKNVRTELWMKFHGASCAGRRFFRNPRRLRTEFKNIAGKRIFLPRARKPAVFLYRLDNILVTLLCSSISGNIGK